MHIVTLVPCPILHPRKSPPLPWAAARREPRLRRRPLIPTAPSVGWQRVSEAPAGQHGDSSRTCRSSCYPGPERAMLELTVAADLALRIAALEAQRGQSDAIGVDHLLIGLLSLEKLVDASGGLAPDQQAAVSTEQQLL